MSDIKITDLPNNFSSVKKINGIENKLSYF